MIKIFYRRNHFGSICREWYNFPYRKNLGRNSIGYKINPDFIPIVKEKLQIDQKDFINTTYEFVKQNEIKTNFNKRKLY